MGLFDFFKKKKTAPAADVHSTMSADINATMSKEEIIKAIMQNMKQKTPSEHFASGAVFDISRQNHAQFANIVHSNNAMALKSFFANAYVTFCNQPQIVGFSESMVDKKRNDTNPGTWNADIMSLPSGEKIALCFMPIANEMYTARIIGIVLGDSEDKYYYCMLNKDEKVPSDVIRNKAMLGTEKVGTVKGLGFELMHSFTECIKNNC